MNYKNVLIISPHFPPLNAPDMHRVRMSLPYFKDYGWIPQIVTVNADKSDIVRDEMLNKSIPNDIKIHYVDAIPKKLSSYFGIGNISFRSAFYYFLKVKYIVKQEKIDLIYFSTTAFPLCVLGYFWKKFYGIPYIIDMQDPWHSDYYKNKPKSEKPPKYWFSYRLNKYLEPIAMRSCDGIISVSKSYIDVLHERYPNLRSKPSKVITFGLSEMDVSIAKSMEKTENTNKIIRPGFFNIIYAGVCVKHMQESIERFLIAVQKGYQNSHSLFCHLRISFIGTSYDPNSPKKLIQPIADYLGLQTLVYEQTERVSFYEVMQLIENADALFIPGTDDPGYTASKLYPYLMAEKPIISIFHEESSVGLILKKCLDVDSFNLNEIKNIQVDRICQLLEKWLRYGVIKPKLNFEEFSQYMASSMTKKQTEVFDEVIMMNL